MTAEMVRDIAMAAFADAIDVLSIIGTLEAGNAPAAVAMSTRLVPMRWQNAFIGRYGRVW
jgi:hypothetical protein